MLVRGCPPLEIILRVIDPPLIMRVVTRAKVLTRTQPCLDLSRLHCKVSHCFHPHTSVMVITHNLFHNLRHVMIHMKGSWIRGGMYPKNFKKSRCLLFLKLIRQCMLLLATRIICLYLTLCLASCSATPTLCMSLSGTKQ